MALLGIATGPAALLGGGAVALALPNVWVASLAQLARAGPRAVAAAAATHLALLLAHALLFARDYAFGGSLFRPAIAAFAIAVAALAAAPGLGPGLGRRHDRAPEWPAVPARLLPALVALVAAGIGLAGNGLAGNGRRGAAPAGPEVAMTWNLQQGCA